MAERHADTLFAPAYDGRLDRTQRRRFDDHLAGCDRCAAAFADHCAAGDALRSLPAVRMPVPVRLPSHAPRAAHRTLRERLGLQSGLALSLVGAAATAVLVGGVALALHGSQGTRKTEALAQAGATSFSTSSAGGAGTAAAQAPAARSDAGGGQSATAFANAVTVQRSGRQGEVLVLATTRQTYAAGSTIQVDARLVLSSPGSGVAPGGAAAQPGSSPGATPAPAAAPQHLAVPDLALAEVIATPVVILEPAAAPAADHLAATSPSPVAVASSAGAPGFFELTIPGTARPGDVLTIVATVPAGLPSSADSSPVTAVLQITVA